MSEADPLPPTAETVLTLLEYEGPLTRQELIATTDRSETAVDEALVTLEKRGYLSRDANPRDLRQVVLEIRPDADV